MLRRQQQHWLPTPAGNLCHPRSAEGGEIPGRPTVEEIPIPVAAEPAFPVNIRGEEDSDRRVRTYKRYLCVSLALAYD